jgi:hypothetical protein
MLICGCEGVLSAVNSQLFSTKIFFANLLGVSNRSPRLNPSRHRSLKNATKKCANLVQKNLKIVVDEH